MTEKVQKLLNDYPAARWAALVLIALAMFFGYMFVDVCCPFSISVQMPLWSSGKRAAGVVEKKIALESARNTFAETADNLDIQNQQLRYNLQNAYETFLNEQDNMEVTGRVFQSTTNKFHFGAASNLELVNASNDLISAQSTYVQAVLSLVNAQVEMNKFLNNK